MTVPLRSFILSADLHVIGARPVARKDEDWLDTQRKALRFLCDQAASRRVPLVLVGDIFDKPKVATECVVMVIQEFQRLREQGQEVYLIAGNHDLPGHRADGIAESSVGILLEIFPSIPQIDGIQDAQHFGQDKDTGAEVVFTHQLVFKDEKSRPSMAKGKTAADLLAENPAAKWIFTGDHHEAWHHHETDLYPATMEVISSRHVVNPGNMIAHNASMIETEAVCAFVDLDSEVVEWIPIPDDPEMLSREHLEAVEQRESRVAAFLERVGDAEGVCLTFADRLEARMQGTDIPETVHQAYLEVRGKATKEEK